MKRLILTTFTLLGLVISAAAQDAGAKKILDAVSAKYSAKTTFKANITYKLEVTSNPSLNESFDADVKIKGSKFQVNKSDGEQFFCDGKYILNVIKDSEETYASDYSKEDNPIDLDKVLNAYKSGYKYVQLTDEVIGGVKCAVIDLNPDKSAEEMATSDVFKIRILVNKTTNEVVQWIVFEKNGNRHKFKINTFNSNVTLGDDVFMWDCKKHPDYTVEDLTEEEAFGNCN